MEVPKYVMSNFSLAAFKFLSLTLAFDNMIVMSWVALCGFNLLGFCGPHESVYSFLSTNMGSFQLSNSILNSY